MNQNSLWQGLQDSAVGIYVAESTWAFPTLETLHVIALVTVFGTIAIMDLRLLGLASRDWAVTAVSRDTLRWTWGAFIMAAVTGSLLFVSKATNYMANPYFLIKMGLIVLAGVNMAVLHGTSWRNVASWDMGGPVPTGARIAAGLSLFFWILVVFFGRAIGFTLGIFQ